MQAVILVAAMAVGGKFIVTPHPDPIKGMPPHPGVVRVFTMLETGRAAGSGSLVAPDLVLTAKHVVADRSSETIEIMFPNWDVVTGKVLEVSDDCDLALIKLDAERIEPPLKIDTCQPGDKLTIHGYGYGPYRPQTGVYKQHGDGGGQCWIEGAQARQGDSGGPVMRDGVVVGVLWGSRENETWFTPGDHILEEFPALKTPAPIILYWKL